MAKRYPKRFRGMELTEDQATQSAYGYIFDNYQTVPPYQASRYANIVNRAKRLLPLWRKWEIERTAHLEDVLDDIIEWSYLD